MISQSFFIDHAQLQRGPRPVYDITFITINLLALKRALDLDVSSVAVGWKRLQSF